MYCIVRCVLCTSKHKLSFSCCAQGGACPEAMSFKPLKPAVSNAIPSLHYPKLLIPVNKLPVCQEVEILDIAEGVYNTKPNVKKIEKTASESSRVPPE